jgi:hypothetical protein
VTGSRTETGGCYAEPWRVREWRLDSQLPRHRVKTNEIGAQYFESMSIGETASKARTLLDGSALTQPVRTIDVGHRGLACR